MYLYILVSIILTLLFAFGCNTAIRKHAGSFYILAALIVLFEVIYYETGLVDTTPEWITSYIINPFNSHVHRRDVYGRFECQKTGHQQAYGHPRGIIHHRLHSHPWT